MKSRLIAALAIAMCFCTHFASAQQPIPTIWQGEYGPTMLVNNTVALPDPYATVGVPSQAPWTGLSLIPAQAPTQDRVWYRIEYLRWKTDGMDVPALVTTSPAGTPQNQAGVLGQPDTSVLFGAGELNGSAVNGIRTNSGYWFRGGRWALETEFFKLARQNDAFARSSDGSVILARPYFNVLTGAQDAFQIAYPGSTSGALQVFSDTKLRSFMINGRVAMLPRGPVCDPCGQPVPQDQLSLLIGYRYAKLEDRLSFAHNRDTLPPAAARSEVVSEAFETRNDFGGLQLGFVHQKNFRRVWLESMVRVAVGNNRQRAYIRGTTTITDGAGTSNNVGGVLAQRTNTGVFKRNRFTMLPEVGLTLGIRATDRLHATIGYSVFYLPNVIRAGDLVDTDANPNLFPPETVPFSGALRPRFRFIDSDYYAHGLNVGGEFRF